MWRYTCCVIQTDFIITEEYMLASAKENEVLYKISDVISEVPYQSFVL